MANKGQGLPISFIVIAAISALVLIIVIAFTVGGLGGFFKQIISPAPEEKGTVLTACTSFCNQLAAASTTDQFTKSTFCTKTFAVDLNKDGKINESESGLTCWGTNIGVTCTAQFGETTLTEKNCVNYGESHK